MRTRKGKFLASFGKGGSIKHKKTCAKIGDGMKLERNSLVAYTNSYFLPLKNSCQRFFANLRNSIRRQNHPNKFAHKKSIASLLPCITHATNRQSTPIFMLIIVIGISITMFCTKLVNFCCCAD